MSIIEYPSDIPVNANPGYRNKSLIFHVPSGQWEDRGPVSLESFERRGWTVTNVSNPSSSYWNVCCR